MHVRILSPRLLLLRVRAPGVARVGTVPSAKPRRAPRGTAQPRPPKGARVGAAGYRLTRHIRLVRERRPATAATENDRATASPSRKRRSPCFPNANLPNANVPPLGSWPHGAVARRGAYPKPDVPGRPAVFHCFSKANKSCARPRVNTQLHLLTHTYRNRARWGHRPGRASTPSRNRSRPTEVRRGRCTRGRRTGLGKSRSQSPQNVRCTFHLDTSHTRARTHTWGTARR